MKARLIRFADKLIVAPLLVLAAWLRGADTGPRAGSAAGLQERPQGTWVVIKLVGMGDAVLTLPALAAIREQPGCRLVAITTPRCGPVWTAPGVADAAIVVRNGRTLIKAAWALRHADGVLDFEQHVFWSAALAMLAPGSARRVGFQTQSRIRNRAYDVRVQPGPGIRHMKEIFDDLARAAGFSPPPGLLPLPVTAETAGGVETWLAQKRLSPRRYLVIAPGSGATVRFRRLPAEIWERVLQALPPDLDVVLVGTRLEAALVEEIECRARRSRPAGAGRTLVETQLSLQRLAQVFAQAWKVVAIDSGPMHLAAATGRPVVGIFGPDSPLRYRPYNPLSCSVSLGLPCSPCNNCWVYREARCTNPDAYACMQRQSPAAIVAAIGAPAEWSRGASA